MDISGRRKKKKQRDQESVGVRRTSLTNSFFELAKKSSVDRLAYLAEKDPPRIVTMSKDADYSFDHWICSICIQSKQVRVLFRCHYTSSVARQLAATATKKLKPQHLHPLTARDFIQEYCNLVLGSIKSGLSHVKTVEIERKNGTHPVMVSSVEPSYDIVDFTGDDDTEQVWRLSWDGGKSELVCVAKIEIFQPLEFSEEDTQQINVNESGQIEFL